MKTLKDITWGEISPPAIRNDPQVQAITGAVTPQQQEVSQAINECIILARLNELPEATVDLLAWQYHVDFYEKGLPLDKKRNLVRTAIDVHRHKGTPYAVESVVSAAFEKSQVIEWFDYGGKPYFFKVRTEDVTTNRQTIDQMKKAINSVKNTRSWLEKIEFVMHMSDEYGEVKEDLGIKIRHGIEESYPWGYQKHDSTLRRGAVIMHNGAILFDGSLRHNESPPGAATHSTTEVEKLGLLSVKMKGFEDRYTTNLFHDGKCLRPGDLSHGAANGPLDGGGYLKIKKGIYFDGRHCHSGGSMLLYDGSCTANGAKMHNGGDIRRHNYTERMERF